MFKHIEPLLNHYANRVNISVTAHPKGMQVTLSIMPCPQKVTDDALRQQLIQPVVLAGNEESLMTELAGLKDSLSTAIENESLNVSVEAFNDALSKAKATSKTKKTTAKSADNTSPATPTATESATAATPAADENSALDDFLNC